MQHYCSHLTWHCPLTVLRIYVVVYYMGMALVISVIAMIDGLVIGEFASLG